MGRLVNLLTTELLNIGTSAAGERAADSGALESRGSDVRRLRLHPRGSVAALSDNALSDS